ncbi:hypothetical protein PR048_013294 [Dryococelus australis]|uniref:Uncharacterized protein n=1 Tax=Dryococelus australis TaxID=614101 RepID=A0ABQ9HSK6_9NEOP|nr:hypothetical protein PR048_013294 [Dryococelus australis]
MRPMVPAMWGTYFEISRSANLHGIVQYGSHLRKSGSDPAGDRTCSALVGGELSATAAKPLLCIRFVSYDTIRQKPDRLKYAPYDANSDGPAKKNIVPAQGDSMTVLKKYTTTCDKGTKQHMFTEIGLQHTLAAVNVRMPAIKQDLMESWAYTETTAYIKWERRRNEGAGEMGDPQENPPTNGIIRYDSDLRKSVACVSCHIMSHMCSIGDKFGDPLIREAAACLAEHIALQGICVDMHYHFGKAQSIPVARTADEHVEQHSTCLGWDQCVFDECNLRGGAHQVYVIHTKDNYMHQVDSVFIAEPHAMASLPSGDPPMAPVEPCMMLRGLGLKTG